MCQWDNLATFADTFEPSHEYLDQLTKDNFAVVFTKDNCQYCHWVQNYLNSVGYASYIIDLDTLTNSQESIAFIQDVLNNNMVPAVYINGYYIGGFTQLKEMYEDGEL